MATLGLHDEEKSSASAGTSPYDVARARRRSAELASPFSTTSRPGIARCYRASPRDRSQQGIREFEADVIEVQPALLRRLPSSGLLVRRHTGTRASVIFPFRPSDGRLSEATFTAGSWQRPEAPCFSDPPLGRLSRSFAPAGHEAERFCQLEARRIPGAIYPVNPKARRSTCPLRIRAFRAIGAASISR